MRAFLRLFGLASLNELNATELRAKKAEAYATAVTDVAFRERGDLVIGGDYTVIDSMYFDGGRRIIVPYGVHNTIIRGSVFADFTSGRTAVAGDIELPETISESVIEGNVINGNSSRGI